MSKEKIIEKIHLLNNMANKAANVFERQNACRLIESLCEKYGINKEKVLSLSKKSKYYFKYKTRYENLLINQCIFKITNSTSGLYVIKRKKLVMSELTELQNEEAVALISVIKNAWSEDVGIFFDAFIQKNKLFGTSTDDDDIEISEDEQRKIDKMFRMMNGISKTETYKQIN